MLYHGVIGSMFRWSYFLCLFDRAVSNKEVDWALDEQESLMKVFLTVKEVAAYLVVSEQYVLSLFEQEKLRAYSFEDDVPLVSNADLQAFIDNHTSVFNPETGRSEKNYPKEES